MPGKKNLRMKAARAAAGLIEAGGYNPTLNLCVAICKTLHVTLNDLFWEDDGDTNTNPFFF